MTVHCLVESGELQIKDVLSSKEIWRGRPEGYEVIMAKSIPYSSDCIALLDWSGKGPQSSNLWRYSVEHGTVWKAELPDSGKDIYTNFQLEETGLVAHSWAGYKVVIDLNTGQILSRQFVK